MTIRNGAPLTRTSRFALATLAAVLAGCASEGTEPPPEPTLVVATTPTTLAEAAVGTVVATVPAFEVRDEAGNPVAGVAVSVAASAGGSVAGAPTVSLDGATSVGTWTLGNVSGGQTLTVTAVGLAPLVFSINTLPGAPVEIVQFDGNNQSGQALAVVPGPIRARVADAFGNGVPAVEVTWAVETGGGQLAATTSVTNAAGLASSPAWTLGTSGAQTISASFGASQVTFSASSSAYQVDVRYLSGTPNETVQLAFNNAAARIATVITGDAPNFTFNNYTGHQGCNASAPALNETLDDVVIFATVAAIDGPGNVLGSAGPCIIRTGGVTLIGFMTFDSADLDALAVQGRLELVILHEMLHVIGVGTLWANKGRLEGANTDASRFTGPLAREVCANNGGATPCAVAVPAENCLDLAIGQACGSGTRDSHWKESTFRTELMTGYLNAGENPLSVITVQSLADIGYVVNLLPADSYTVPPPALQALMAPGLPALRLPEPTKPMFAVDAAGRSTKLPEQQ